MLLHILIHFPLLQKSEFHFCEVQIVLYIQHKQNIYDSRI